MVYSKKDWETMDKVWEKLRNYNGKSITLTKNDVVEGDNFLIFGFGYDEHTITFRKRYDGVWVIHFTNDEPILLEECPITFYYTLLKNL